MSMTKRGLRMLVLLAKYVKCCVQQFTYLLLTPRLRSNRGSKGMSRAAL
jgi:hypothetical protein